MKKEKGQVILILVLVMTVALAIGISVIQRSLSDISTASKAEQSSRAFSAAEAGIEQVLKGGSPSINFIENNSSATVEGNDLIPIVPAVNTRQDPLEYPLLVKEEVAHVWLADPDSNVNLPQCTAINPSGHLPICYKQNTLDVYWGNSTLDKAALELTLVYYDDVSSQYVNRKWYIDNDAASRNPTNNFDAVTCSGYQVGTNTYQCKKTLGNSSGVNAYWQGQNGPLSSSLMLIRARLLYSNTAQPFAVQAVGTCGQDCSIPPQGRRITSTGTAGQTQRKIQLFQINKVVPPYFDYAVFSAGTINK